MRRWLRVTASAAVEVADHPQLWLPGALAWAVGVGWIALVAGVLRPPSVAELTFFGARAATSGLWPWNLVAGLALAAMLVAAAFGLSALAEMALLHGGRVVGSDVVRALGVTIACAVPASFVLLALGVALPVVAAAEFNAADADGGPLLRTIARLWPLIAALAVAWMAGTAIHAAALRRVVRGRSASAALREAPGRLARLGLPAALQTIGIGLARIGYLLLAAVLLRVLWDPIGGRLAGEGFGIAGLLLLVGFVAIWLCLVLAGGALHAWGSVSWTRLLGASPPEAAADLQQMERRPGP